MKEGLSLVAPLGCNQTISESDCLEAIEAVGGSTIWWIDGAALYADYMAHWTACGLAGAKRGGGGGAAARCGAGPPAHGGADPKEEEEEPAAGFVMEDAMAEEVAEQATILKSIQS